MKYRFAEQNIDVEVNIDAEPELDVLGVPANEDLMKKKIKLISSIVNTVLPKY